MSRATALTLALLALSGCGDSDRPPDSVTPSEARQLNDAAAMLDAQSMDANAIDVDQSKKDAKP